MENEQTETVETCYSRIMASALFRTDGTELVYTAEIIKLANLVAEDPRGGEELDSIGEFEIVGLWDLLIGAYWAFVHCHGGQFTPEYAAQCVISAIYTPGCGEDAPEEDDPARVAYDEICEVLLGKDQ